MAAGRHSSAGSRSAHCPRGPLPQVLPAHRAHIFRSPDFSASGSHYSEDALFDFHGLLFGGRGRMRGSVTVLLLHPELHLFRGFLFFRYDIYLCYFKSVLQSLISVNIRQNQTMTYIFVRFIHFLTQNHEVKKTAEIRCFVSSYLRQWRFYTNVLNLWWLFQRLREKSMYNKGNLDLRKRTKIVILIKDPSKLKCNNKSEKNCRSTA